MLIGRLVQIQWWQQGQFSSRATRQQEHRETLPARPGDLFDRRGRLLASTVTVSGVFVDPARVTDSFRTACTLAQVTSQNPTEIQQRILDHREKRFLWIKRRLTESEVDALLTSNLPSEEWGLQQEYVRVYPQGALAAHILGWRDIDQIPHGGVEETFHARLMGETGTRTVVRDARGFVIGVNEEKTLLPRNGQDVHLTIDIMSQWYLEQRLDLLMQSHQPLGACAIAIDPMSGEILAMASRPSFHPAHPEDAPVNSWRNLAIQAAYEPGSTIKPVLVAAGLDRGLVQPTDTIDCERGAYRMGPRVLHDHHRYVVLSLKDILVKSSNIGMAKIGEKLTNTGMHEVLARFNFGRKTGIELPGELPGTLHPLEKWTIYSTGSIPMGQEMQATPLQILAAHSALANRGRWITPHLLRSDKDQRAVSPNVVSTDILSSTSTRWVVEEALTDVVRRGTGTKAQLDQYQLFGKTGTAQKMDPDGRYSHTRHISSFVCGAPIENPRLVVIVTVDEPTRGGSDYGGIVAAPVAAGIVSDLLKYMQVPCASPSSQQTPSQTADQPLRSSRR